MHMCILYFFNTLACLVVGNRFESPDNRRQNRKERVPTTACTMGRVTSGFSLTYKKLAPPVLTLIIWEKIMKKVFYFMFGLLVVMLILALIMTPAYDEDGESIDFIEYWTTSD